MDIKAMHYNIRRKLNKVDSEQFRNLLIPEIDQVLNEAVDIFIGIVASPRYRTQLGFEKTQRSIDDIMPLVKSEHNEDNHYDVANDMVSLPEDYRHYVSSYVLVSKGNCQAKIDTTIIQHDDNAENNSNHKSSFEWRKINAEFNANGVKFYNDGSFQINKFCISYIRKPEFIHNAEDFSDTGYTLPSGTVLSGTKNCELPDHTHGEVVDIAVMLLSGELQNPGVQFHMSKLKLNQLN